MHKPFEHLLPKIVAGGLSAGLVLVWWPTIFPQTAGAASWVWRGLFWTLIFELLLGLLVPLQEKIASSRWGQNIKDAIKDKGVVLGHLTPNSSALSVAVLVVVALALPAGLIVSGPDRAQSRASVAIAPVETTKIVKPVKVVRITKVVKEKEIRVVPQIKREVRIVRLPAKSDSQTGSSGSASSDTSSKDNPDTPTNPEEGITPK